MGCRGVPARRAGRRGQRRCIPDRALAAAGAVARTGLPARTARRWRLLGDPHGCRDGRRMAVTSRRAVRSRDPRRVLALWTVRDHLLAGLDACPQVLGHGDYHPRNIMLPPEGEDVV